MDPVVVQKLPSSWLPILTPPENTYLTDLWEEDKELYFAAEAAWEDVALTLAASDEATYCAISEGMEYLVGKGLFKVVVERDEDIINVRIGVWSYTHGIYKRDLDDIDLGVHIGMMINYGSVN